MSTATVPKIEPALASRDDVTARGTHLRAVLGLIGLTLAIYWPVWQFGFLNWDDPWYVVENSQIRSWDLANLFRIASEPSVKNYAPLTTLSFLIDYTLWGDFAGGYHATNLLLHAVNAVLVYALLWQLSGSRGVSLLTAALFAIHPVQLESVAWISSRKGLLSATFVLASLRFWFKPNRQPRDEGYGLLFLFLALLAKAIAVVVPAVVLTYDVWIARKKLSEAVTRQFFAGLLCVMFLLLTMSAQTTMYGGLRGHMTLGKLHILAIDTIVLWRYIGMLIWPDSLCVLYDPSTSGISLSVAAASLAWGAVIFVAWRTRESLPWLRGGLLTAFVFLVPVLNLVPITTLMNDRYLYLPSIPLFAVFASGLRCLQKWAAKRQADGGAAQSQVACAQFASIVVTLVAVSGFALVSLTHLPVWRNSTTLWTHADEKVGHLPVVQYQFADAQYAAGDKSQAIARLERALENPELDAGDRKRFRETLREWRGDDKVTR